MFAAESGVTPKTVELRKCLASRELRRAQFANNRYARAYADAIGACINHRAGRGRGTNAARSFHARLIADHSAHEGNIFRRCGAKKTGGRFYKVGLCRQTELTAQDLFFQSEQRSLENHFQDGPTSVRYFGYGRNVILNAVPVA